jgi:hypothetical protein
VDNKVVLLSKYVTGKDELEAAFEILMKWFSLTRDVLEVTVELALVLEVPRLADRLDPAIV